MLLAPRKQRGQQSRPRNRNSRRRNSLLNVVYVHVINRGSSLSAYNENREPDDEQTKHEADTPHGR
jgi:hypothetical protein